MCFKSQLVNWDKHWEPIMQVWKFLTRISKVPMSKRYSIDQEMITMKNISQPSGVRRFKTFLAKFLINPHSSIDSVVHQRKAQLTAILSLVLICTSGLGMLFSLPQSNSTFILLGCLSGFSLVGYLLTRTQYPVLGSLILVITLSVVGFSIVLLGSDNPIISFATTLPLAFVIGSALLPVWGIGILALINILGVLIIPVLNPSFSLRDAGTTLAILIPLGGLLISVQIFRNKLERARLREEQISNQELRELGASLEQRIADATRNLELAAEIGRRVSMVRDIDMMLSEAVNIIRERFDLYYTQIYLADSTEHTLILRAGTGNVGQTLLNNGLRLSVDMSSLNGIAATERRPVIVDDTDRSTLHRHNPLLPETRSEMVVPLLVGERVVGVLDLQSRFPGALSAKNLPAFEALAGQLAISVSNAELFKETEQAQAVVEEQAQYLTLTGWQDFMDAIERRERLAYVYEQNCVSGLHTVLPDFQGEDGLITPIRINGIQIGKFYFKRDHAWTEEDFATSNAIAYQVAQQIENLRLLTQAKQYQAETQETLKQLTREGWEGYQKEFVTQTGFVFNDHEVKPISEIHDCTEERLAFKIKVRDETIGELGILDVDALSEQDIDLVTFVNKQLSDHLENLRLSTQTKVALSETEDQTRRLTALNTLSKELANARDIEDVFKVAAQLLPKMITADQITTTRLSENQEYLQIYQFQGGDDVIPTGIELSVTGSTSGESIEQRRPINIHDLRTDDHSESRALRDEGFLSTLVIPIVVSGQAIGTFNFSSTETNFYSERDRDLGVQAASLISSAIENRQLFNQVQEALAETEAMLEITNVASSSLELETTLSQVLSKVLETTAACSGLISVYNPQTQNLELISYQLPEPLLNKLLTNGLEGTLCDLVYKGKDTILVEDLKLESPIDATGLIKLGFHAYQGVPLTTKGKVTGTLCVFYPMAITAQNADTALMEVVGQQIGVAIENANMFEQTQKRAAELATVSELGTIITKILDTQEILNTVVDLVKERFDLYHAQIYMMDKDAENLVLAAGAGEIGHQLMKDGWQIPMDANQSIVAQTARQGKGLIIDNVKADPGFMKNTLLPDTASEMSIPLFSSDQVLGVMDLQSDKIGNFTEEDISIQTTLASQVAVSIQNAETHARTQNQAENEATINLINQRIQSTTSVESAVQVAIGELGRVLGAKRTNVQLGITCNNGKKSFHLWKKCRYKFKITNLS
jgi:GAF domain-containing protein